MAEFNIDDVIKDAKGRILIKSGKLTYAFGDSNMVDEMANRAKIKPHDVGLQMACRKIKELNPTLTNPIALKNIKVLY